MQNSGRYPRINLRSKNELAKRISDKSFSFQSSLKLINDVLKNYNDYWYDSKQSQPEKGKFVRSSVGKPLGKLLKRINRKVLISYDKLVPNFIFGGISKKNHIQAAYSLLGKQKKRILLGLDLSTFFEQIRKERIFYLFYAKCGCSARVSRILANVCCVPAGKKGSGSKVEVLARGFSTSSRLSVWTNLDTFTRLKWVTDRDLRNHDPKIVIFVDDIGISASRVTKNKLEILRRKIQAILSDFDCNQYLPINNEKTKIRSFAEGVEHLGLRLGRNKITAGYKTKKKLDKIKSEIKSSSGLNKKNLVNKLKAYYIYKKQIKNVYNNPSNI